MSKSICIESQTKSCSGRDIICLSLINQPNLQLRGHFLSKEISLERKIKEVGNILLEIINENETKEACTERTPIRDVSSILKISTSATIDVTTYISRIVKFLELSEIELIHILIIMDRLLRNAFILLNGKNVHKLILICSYISDKMLKDSVYPNSYYSAVYGISIKEIIELEYQCLEALEYNLLVSEEDFNSYVETISLC